MIFIESKENNLFKNTKKLKERKNRNKSNKYIIEGFRLVQEAFKYMRQKWKVGEFKK